MSVSSSSYFNITALYDHRRLGDIVANIRRGLGRVGKVLIVWGILITLFLIGSLIIASTPISLQGGVILMFIAVAWAPFVLFKLLFWIGSGFVESDDEDEKPTD